MLRVQGYVESVQKRGESDFLRIEIQDRDLYQTEVVSCHKDKIGEITEGAKVELGVKVAARTGEDGRAWVSVDVAKIIKLEFTREKATA